MCTEASFSSISNNSQQQEQTIVGVSRRTAVLFKNKQQQRFNKMPSFDKDLPLIPNNEDFVESKLVTEKKGKKSNGKSKQQQSSGDPGLIMDLKSDEEESFTDTEESDTEETQISLSLTGSNVLSKNFLEPLNLVWAKLPSSPWHPAIIMNPNTVKSDLQIIKIKNVNAPPADVLKPKESMKNDYFVFLFEKKNPWYVLINFAIQIFNHSLF